jgi:lysozyme
VAGESSDAVKTATRERLRDSLKLHEGLRLKPYKDSIGKLTIGFGRNLDDNGIRPNEAAYMLEGDIDEAEQGLLINHPWAEDIDQVRLAVLTEMHFNLGAKRFAGFKRMLAAAKAGNVDQAAVEMLDSKWFEQVGNRALTLAERYRTGRWE